MTDVRRYWHGRSGHLTLVVSYEKELYYGQVQLDDELFCQMLLDALTACLGRSMHDIENINIT